MVIKACNHELLFNESIINLFNNQSTISQLIKKKLSQQLLFELQIRYTIK